MTDVSPHKRDECGVAYQTAYISEYGPRRTAVEASVYFPSSIYGFCALRFIITFNSPGH